MIYRHFCQHLFICIFKLIHFVDGSKFDRRRRKICFDFNECETVFIDCTLNTETMWGKKVVGAVNCVLAALCVASNGNRTIHCGWLHRFCMDVVYILDFSNSGNSKLELNHYVFNRVFSLINETWTFWIVKFWLGEIYIEYN